MHSHISVVVLSLAFAQAAAAQEDLESIMRETVSYDITARRAAGGEGLHTGIIVTGRIEEIQIPQGCIPSEMKFYRIEAAITHAGISYTMAERNGRLLRIGGFTEPQVVSLAQWLDVEGQSPKTLACVSRSLAFLLASAGNDTVLVIGPKPGLPKGLPDSWFQRPEAKWVIGQRQGDGTNHVAVTAVGHDYLSDAWESTHFVFLYDERGELKGWSSHAGGYWRESDPPS